MNVQNRISYAFALVAVLALAGIASSLKLQDFADDLFFSHVLENTTLHDFLIENYNTWSGRFTLNALMVGTINHHNVWKIGIPLSVVILCASISRITVGKFDLRITVLSVFLYLFIPKEVLANGSWWVTGFYNYLLPAAAMAYSLSVFIRKGSVGWIEGSLSLLCLSLSCFSEQTSIATLAASFFLIVFCREYRRSFSYVYILSAVVLTWFLFSAPGNFHRFQEETWRWMPGFESESLVTKIIYGYDRIHQAIVMPNSIIFSLLCTLCLLLIYRDEQRTKTGNFFALVLLGHLVLMLLIRLGVAHLGESFYNSDLLNPHRWISYSRYASYFVTSLVILGVCYALAISAIRDNEYIKPFSIVILGFATVLMVGFSPTVYASGMRVLYLWAVMILSASCFIFYRLYGNDRSLINNVIICAMAAYVLSI